MADNARAMSLRTRAFALRAGPLRVPSLRASIAIAARSDTVQCGIWGFLIAFIATGGLL